MPDVDGLRAMARWPLRGRAVIDLRDQVVRDVPHQLLIDGERDGRQRLGERAGGGAGGAEADRSAADVVGGAADGRAAGAAEVVAVGDRADQAVAEVLDRRHDRLRHGSGVGGEGRARCRG